jgi:hypothetical protein
MARCAFSGREIDQATPGWLKTPDGKVVFAQFYEGYLARMKKEQAEAQSDRAAVAPVEVKKEAPKAVAPKKSAAPKAPKAPKKTEGKTLEVVTGSEMLAPSDAVQVSVAPAEPEAPAADPAV